MKKNIVTRKRSLNFQDFLHNFSASGVMTGRNLTRTEISADSPTLVILFAGDVKCGLLLQKQTCLACRQFHAILSAVITVFWILCSGSYT